MPTHSPCIVLSPPHPLSYIPIPALTPQICYTYPTHPLTCIILWSNSASDKNLMQSMMNEPMKLNLYILTDLNKNKNNGSRSKSTQLSRLTKTTLCSSSISHQSLTHYCSIITLIKPWFHVKIKLFQRTSITSRRHWSTIVIFKISGVVYREIFCIDTFWNTRIVTNINDKLAN